MSRPLLANSIEIRSVDNNSSPQWIRSTVAAVGATSKISLFILVITLTLPIMSLAIGSHYKDPRYCPIEPRISMYLIVHGSFLLILNFLAIIVSIFTLFLVFHQVLFSLILIFIFTIIMFLSSIFLLIWLIVGSVWTFRVHNRVTHEYDIINQYYTYNYCHSVLYRFTFIYLILTYIFIVISCLYHIIRKLISSKRKI